VRGRLGDLVFGTGSDSLEEVAGRLLLARGKTVAVAESCTGGLIGDRLTNVPGSSVYFLHGVVAYSNAAKVTLLDVSPHLFEQYGAVSEPVALAMAYGAQRRAGSDLALGVTGIAGPTGGTAEKPVGLVYCALVDREGGGRAGVALRVRSRAPRHQIPGQPGRPQSAPPASPALGSRRWRHQESGTASSLPSN